MIIVQHLKITYSHTHIVIIVVINGVITMYVSSYVNEFIEHIIQLCIDMICWSIIQATHQINTNVAYTTCHLHNIKFIIIRSVMKETKTRL